MSSALSFPRTGDYLFLLNLRPERWPAGDPEKHQSVGPYGDVNTWDKDNFDGAHLFGK